MPFGSSPPSSSTDNSRGGKARARTLRALALGAALWPRVAAAHIELEEPLARYEIQNFEVGIKSCPCGLGGSNRVCNLPQDASDDFRDESRASRFVAGSTITLRVNEYVGHSGRFRVAFDLEGADMADFNDDVLLDVPDPNDGTGVRELTVTLPDVTCDRCTLQVVQAMHGDTANPVLDPAPISSYYACVDLVLVASEEELEGTPSEDPGEPEPVDDTSMAEPEAADPVAGEADEDPGEPPTGGQSAGEQPAGDVETPPAPPSDAVSGAPPVDSAPEVGEEPTPMDGLAPPGPLPAGGAVSASASEGGGCSVAGPRGGDESRRASAAWLLSLGLLATRRRRRPRP